MPCAAPGKRIAIGFDDDLWLAIHLMIAGRLHWDGKRQPLAASNSITAR